ncbi:MAG: alpha/beta hydrolase [Flavobacteriales bacterium]|nr:alpha/beta hydrolase [Flavobacteriales bacterium]
MKESNKSFENSSKFSFRMFDNKKSTTVLLLHGFLGSQHIWDNMIKDLSDHFNILTIDLPGHGDTPSNQEILYMNEIANSVISFAQGMMLKQFHVVGHSMGGYIGLEILYQHPEKIESLTLLNSTAMADSEQKKADRLRAVKVFELSPAIYVKEAIANLFYSVNLEKFPEQVSLLQQIALHADPKGAQACLRGMRERKDFVELINNTSIPVQYLSGIHDNTVPYDGIVNQIKSSEVKLVSFEQSGHMSFVEERDKCVSAIVNFINKIGS